MKTLTQTLCTVALTAVVFTSSAFTTFASVPSTKISALVASHPGFNKIWVSGNVKVILTQGEKESVIGTNNYNAEKTSVLSKGQTLYINSMESSQVTINITVKDLMRIEAYGQSEVVTSSTFDVKYLQLFLNQSATARISANTKGLYTIVNDNAVLKISGTSDKSTFVASNMSNVKFNKFFSLRSAQYASMAIMEAEQEVVSVSR